MALTTGFVQRTIVSGEVVCLWVGEDPSSAELLFLVFNANESAARTTAKRTIAAVLVEAHVCGRLVEVTHGNQSAEITGCTYPEPDLDANDVHIDALEATQAVQDLAQSVALLAGKRTVVRVYLSKHSNPPRTVTGELSVRQGPLDPPLVVPSVNQVVLDPVDAGNVTLQRNDEQRSLNFVLEPPQTAEGALHIRLSRLFRTNGDEISFGGNREPVVWFHRTPPMRLRIVGIRYQYSDPADSPPDTIIPANIDYSRLLSWLQRAYPVAQVISTQILVWAPGGPIFTPESEFNSNAINAHVAAIRALDVDEGMDARTLYYGLVSDAGFFMRGKVGSEWVSCGPTGPGTWGWDFDGSYGDWYGGHEIGHSLGRPHPGFCNQLGFDPNYPFPNGQLSASSDGFTGFDVGDPLGGLSLDALPGTVWHDVMTYCDNQWTSVYTYREMRRRLLSVETMPAQEGEGPPARGGSGGASGGRPDNRFPEIRPTVHPERVGDMTRTAQARETRISVVATINFTRRSGEIRYVNPLRNLPPTPEEAESRVVVVIRRPDGTEESRHPVRVNVDPERLPGEDEVGLVDVVIPVASDSGTVELLVDGELADTFQAGEPAAIRGLRNVSTSARDLAISVDFDQSLEGAGSYAAQISTDGGRMWQTVAVGLKDPTFHLDRSDFPPGSEVRLRILASGGFTSSVVTTETLRI